jgi:hypothetical protein
LPLLALITNTLRTDERRTGAEAEWKATEYDIAQMHLDEIGVPTELHQGGDRLSIVGRINILWRRAMKAESDLETINLRHGLKL